MIDTTFTLQNKVAMVVGAANGIGRATALAFAAAGAAVACADVEEAGAKTIAAEIEDGGAHALPVHLDVTDGASCRAAVAATVERFGGLDVLLYGAADSDRTATVLEMDEAAWDRVIRINLTGAFLTVKAAIPAMIARGGGSVILIASQLGPGRVTRTRRVLRDEGRAGPAREGARRRSRGAGHSREHDLARRDRDAAHAPPVEGHGRGARDDGAEASPGTHRSSRGDRTRRPLSSRAMPPPS